MGTCITCSAVCVNVPSKYNNEIVLQYIAKLYLYQSQLIKLHVHHQADNSTIYLNHEIENKLYFNALQWIYLQ